MSFPAFLFAILALLLAPGPTNTLMALGGAQGGVRTVVRLIPAEVTGYLITILMLAFAGAQVLAHWPVAGVVLKIIAALWVLLLAIRLWRMPADEGGQGGVTRARVFITTMLNPKALVFALVLLPPPAGAAFVPRLAVLIFSVVMVALLWGFAGSLARVGNDGRQRMQVVQRIASVWLALVSMGLIAGMVRA